jgi:beta-phosphoglucomutase
VKKKYRAVLFDLDGVICHTDKYHYLAWKELADGIGINFDEKINNRMRGVGRMQSLDILLGAHSADFSADEKMRMAEKKNNDYKRYLIQMNPDDLEDEVFNTLKIIRTMGLKMAIGSSSKNTPLILKQIGLKSFFDAVSDGNSISRPKPDPEVYLLACSLISEEPKACLVVEDAVSGIEAAFAAGMDCAAMGDAAKYKIATYDLARFSDILSVLSI